MFYCRFLFVLFLYKFIGLHVWMLDKYILIMWKNKLKKIHKVLLCYHPGEVSKKIWERRVSYIRPYENDSFWTFFLFKHMLHNWSLEIFCSLCTEKITIFHIQVSGQALSDLSLSYLLYWTSYFTSQMLSLISKIIFSPKHSHSQFQTLLLCPSVSVDVCVGNDWSVLKTKEVLLPNFYNIGISSRLSGPIPFPPYEHVEIEILYEIFLQISS